MTARALRAAVCEANLELVRRGLVIESFGNASGIDRARGLVAIKPSGLPYDRLTPASLVLTDLDGRVVEGRLRPSSDLPDAPGAVPRLRRASAASCTRTRDTRPSGRRPAARFRAWAPPTPTTTLARCPSRVR